MRFRGLDLNLLVALQALLEECSVSAAAERLNISQPGMSASLKRLREYFDDDLLQSNGRTMVPTSHALQIEGHLQRILKELDVFVSQTAHFDPLVSTRTFKVVASEYILTVLITPLVLRMKKIAPNIKLRVIPPNAAVYSGLLQGRIDLAVIPEVKTVEGISSKVLMEENFVVVGCANNPLLEGEFTEEKFYQSEHVITKIGGDSPNSVLEQQIEERGISRRSYIQVASFLAAPEIVVGTSLLAGVHERLARKLAKVLPIKIVPYPFEMRPMTEFAYFNSARDNDLGLNWLLRLFESQAKEFKSESGD